MVLSFICLLLLSAGSTGADGQNPQKTSAAAEEDTNSTASEEKSPKVSMDSLFVIHFHPTVQCSCCINVGSFARKGLEIYYAEPYQERRIIFRECNIDEDSASAEKYEIFGSALGFERFYGEKAEFKEIDSVWEFCEDPGEFLPHFRRELDGFLRSSIKDTSQVKPQDADRDEKVPGEKK
jgi:hypothetical protein